uniref:Acrosin n=1 Tax=Tachypleus tridentatus TaxID=6853 RepID=I2FJS7_TACTR|nr:complement component 2/factor B variant 1 [Tachypleus tridentatus]
MTLIYCLYTIFILVVVGSFIDLVQSAEVTKKCKDPGISPDGERKGHCCFTGNKLIFSCKKGFDLVGNPLLQCLPSGVWTSPRPLCKPKNAIICPFPPEIPKVTKTAWKSGDYYLPGDEVEMYCETSYRLLSGSEYLYCEENGEWDSQFPVCGVTECKVPEGLENGKISERQDTNLTLVPENFELNFICNQNYRLIGSSWIKCTYLGWSSALPTCQLITCPDPGVPENGLRKGAGPFNIGDRVIFSCFPQYKIIGSEERICLGNGRWSGLLSSCNHPNYYCPDPGVPVGGIKSGSSYDLRDTINFFCKPGYSFIGSANRTCQMNHTWSGEQVFCLEPYYSDSPTDALTRLNNVLDEKESEQKPISKISLWHIFKTSSNNNFGMSTNKVSKMLANKAFEMSSRRIFQMSPRIEPRRRRIDLNFPGRLVIYFVFDASGSIGRKYFNSAIKFAKGLVTRMGVKEFGTRFGAVSFSSTVSASFLPQDYTTEEEVLNGLDQFDFTEGGTAISSALDFVKTQMIPLSKHTFADRPMKTIIFLLTDGKANMRGDPKQVAKELKADVKAEIYSIALTGDYDINKLREVASSKKDHVYILKDYETLDWLVNAVVNGTIDYSICGYGMDEVVEEVNKPGGTRAEKPWPWMAAVYYRLKENERFRCGGSIVDREWILTAAHCVQNKDPQRKKNQNLVPADIIVKLGVLNVLNSSDLEEFEVAEIHRNENYNFTTYDHDIALLKLDRPVTYKPFVRPICLPPFNVPENSILYKPGQSAFATGWGYDQRVAIDEIVPFKRVDQLKQIHLPIQSRETCVQSLENTKDPMTDVMICAGDGRGVADTCQGDSGGPLAQSLLDESGMNYWIQVGIISWGRGCKNRGQYGFYTHVAKLRPWIDKVMNS